MNDLKLQKQLELTNEQTSPLFRIMWTQQLSEPNKRHFENNICAFHVGKGYILSVAHNLKTEAKIFKSIEESIFVNSVLPYLNEPQKQFFQRCFVLDTATQMRYWSSHHPGDYQQAVDILKQINFDTRWVTFLEKKICQAHLIVQFKNKAFFNKPELIAHFNEGTCFAEPAINRHTFLIELELVEAFYADDIALYRIINTPQEVIDCIPSVAIDYTILSDTQQEYYCLQSSPTSEVGKLLNKAQIEGFTEHFAVFQERVGGNYLLEGLRYLIKGYFRFGSSGAPYLVYDSDAGCFKVNAVQSEACPIQLSIENKRDGNFQYVNAIATPLYNIKTQLETYLQS